MALVVCLVLLGPAQTIAGKYVQHAPEYLELHPARPLPLPSPLPRDVDALCRLIESGHETAELFAALGDALIADGRPKLAYRAFHRAHRLKPKDAEWGRSMVRRKGASTRVPDPVIEAEEREARLWVEALQEYERERIRHDQDPTDLAPFYERYGRAEENMRAVVRRRRFSWAGGAAGIVLGFAFALGAPLVSKRVAWLPLAVGALCLAGPAIVGETGLFWWGGAFAFAGGAAVLVAGRRPA